jgi:RNA polymerase sigma-70 factor (ECF subfamily)
MRSVPHLRPVSSADPAPGGAAAPPDRAREEAHERLVAGLREGRAWAQRALLEDHTGLVERVLVRILGRFRDLDDLTQEVFLRVLDRVDEIREPAALRGFVASVAVFVAREAIRSKRRRRWLVFLAPADQPEPEATGIDEEARAALAELYQVLDRMDDDVRVAFSLRYLEGMEVVEVAQACGVSLSTIKRRLRDGEATMAELAVTRPTLHRFIEEGGRWPVARTS